MTYNLITCDFFISTGSLYFAQQSSYGKVQSSPGTDVRHSISFQGYFKYDDNMNIGSLFTYDNPYSGLYGIVIFFVSTQLLILLFN